MTTTTQYLVDADHPKSAAYTFRSAPVDVHEHRDGNFFATHPKLGCGKTFATPEAAITHLFRDHACSVIRIVPARLPSAEENAADPSGDGAMARASSDISAKASAIAETRVTIQEMARILRETRLLLEFPDVNAAEVLRELQELHHSVDEDEEAVYRKRKTITATERGEAQYKYRRRKIVLETVMALVSERVATINTPERTPEVPETRLQLTNAIVELIQDRFNDPVVSFTKPSASHIRLRVECGEAGPRYYNIRVSEEV